MRRRLFTPQSWYSFLVEAESTPGPKCGWKVHRNTNQKRHSYADTLGNTEIYGDTFCKTGFSKSGKDIRYESIILKRK
jgi:hypothetical protein